MLVACAALGAGCHEHGPRSQSVWRHPGHERASGSPAPPGLHTVRAETERRAHVLPHRAFTAPPPPTPGLTFAGNACGIHAAPRWGRRLEILSAAPATTLPARRCPKRSCESTSTVSLVPGVRWLGCCGPGCVWRGVTHANGACNVTVPYCAVPSHASEATLQRLSRTRGRTHAGLHKRQPREPPWRHTSTPRSGRRVAAAATSVRFRGIRPSKSSWPGGAEQERSSRQRLPRKLIPNFLMSLPHKHCWQRRWGKILMNVWEIGMLPHVLRAHVLVPHARTTGTAHTHTPPPHAPSQPHCHRRHDARVHHAARGSACAPCGGRRAGGARERGGDGRLRVQRGHHGGEWLVYDDRWLQRGNGHLLRCDLR